MEEEKKKKPLHKQLDRRAEEQHIIASKKNYHKPSTRPTEETPVQPSIKTSAFVFPHNKPRSYTATSGRKPPMLAKKVTATDVRQTADMKELSNSKIKLPREEKKKGGPYKILLQAGTKPPRFYMYTI